MGIFQKRRRHIARRLSLQLTADHQITSRILYVNTPKRVIFYRWMQRATRSCFATSMVQECTTVLDCTSAGARHEIDHDAPPQVRFYKNDTIHSYHSLPKGIKKMCPPRLPFFLLKLKTLHKKLTRESSPSLTEEMKGKQIVSERLPSLR